MSLENKNRAELVERALAGQSAEVKARVLAIIIRYDIDVRNEFFLIFVAIGHLLAIVEEAPENWRALFDEFERKLDEWSDQNLKTLAAIHQQGEAAERMSQSFLRLTDSLKGSATKTKELQSDLKALNRTLQTLSGSLGSINSNSQALVSKFSRTEQLIEESQKQRTRASLISGSLLALLFGGFMALGWQQYRQGERIGWLLEKAARNECLTGVVPPETDGCQQYF